ncbi:hypothetical protein GCK72_000095 [Caenorhabditis remanei]|uniref:Glycerol-3-phosphate dehydrogenase n=1 Tax=Caenorhabditis remanei TaxID=31234 RepID=A0A6A5HPU3_CAERE|nr:hypothetical protein GCK72_000095 [Caenorhabditis remanei]KAF1768283.1 hypothetical protein GCK72_000095 [Caenorhabditis remanei]
MSWVRFTKTGVAVVATSAAAMLALDMTNEKRFQRAKITSEQFTADRLAELNKRAPSALPTRKDILTSLNKGDEFDVLIIGGGATGAGVALDAQTRGLKTALVELDDFSSGTSSRSTKLIHGGVRYLQVRENPKKNA